MLSTENLDALKPPHYSASKTAWLLTFIDLTSILVGFFVLLFSTQTIDKSTWTSMTGGFQSAFSSRPGAVIPATPDGNNNALTVATGETSGLGYLDSLLHQRVAKDPVWSRLVAKGQGEAWAHEMYYDIPAEVQNITDTNTQAVWRRLGDVMRGWKNPLQVRVVVPEKATPKIWTEASQKALALTAMLTQSGVEKVVADVRFGPQPGPYLVVKME